MPRYLLPKLRFWNDWKKILKAAIVCRPGTQKIVQALLSMPTDKDRDFLAEQKLLNPS